MLGDSVNTYGWNAESEIKSAAGVNYIYDGDGNRIQKSNGKIYWYGAGTEILDESDSSGNITDEYVFFSGKRVAHRVVSSGSISYYAEDFLGSSRAITTSTGTLCYDADFYPYGGERVITNSCAQNYKFEAKERDTETGNDDFGARYYTSRLGRWLSADWSAVPAPVPYANLANPQTLNLYAMVSDNPEAFADLNGHEGEGSGDSGGSSSNSGSANSPNSSTAQPAQQPAPAPPPPPPSQTGQNSGSAQKLSVGDVSKIIETAQNSKADPVTTALSIFDGMGTNASVTGDTLRSALTANNITPEGDNAKLINNIDSITKTGNDVTINNHSNLTAGHVSEQKTVSFSVGKQDSHPAITNIQGIKGGIGIMKTQVKSVEVVSTSGKQAVLKIETGIHTFTHTIGGP
jgi:RHS repeat-associated protein